MKELLQRIDELQTLIKYINEIHIKDLEIIKELRNEIINRDKLIADKNTLNNNISFQLTQSINTIDLMKKEIDDLNIKLFALKISTVKVYPQRYI